MSISLVYLLFTALLMTVFFTIVFKNISRRFKILMNSGTPAIGGISMGLALLLSYLFYWYPSGIESWRISGILIASTFLLVFGIADDSRELSVVHKFFIQACAAVIVILFGVRTHIVYIGGMLNILITLIWILGITNAFNLLDVMDGLAGIIAIIASAAFCVISFFNADLTNAVLSLVLTGTICGFLFFNLPPAKAYMGNAGSHFIGFILAAAALNTHYAGLENKIALIAPILILGFPIFDTAFLIFMRIKKGKSAFNKSNDHLALRFLKAGYSKPRALAAMATATIFFAVCGTLLTRISNILFLVIITMAILFSFAIAKKLSVINV
jgi:UDP-GlcNAc:undecaprenyl-phosphate GlcNAc-1-phosphate transferase